MCKFESPQKESSRAQSADSSKTCNLQPLTVGFRNDKPRYNGESLSGSYPPIEAQVRDGGHESGEQVVLYDVEHVAMLAEDQRPMLSHDGHVGVRVRRNYERKEQR